MLASTLEPPILVIDAGIAAFTVLGGSINKATERAWAGWRKTHAELFAPQLWRFEVTSMLRKANALGDIKTHEAQDGLAAILAFNVTLVAPDDELCRSALRWAERLKQSAAYDGFYLALASRLQAEFWTTDRRLANAARQSGVRWTHWIGELETKDG